LPLEAVTFFAEGTAFRIASQICASHIPHIIPSIINVVLTITLTSFLSVSTVAIGTALSGVISGKCEKPQFASFAWAGFLTDISLSVCDIAEGAAHTRPNKRSVQRVIAAGIG